MSVLSPISIDEEDGKIDPMEKETAISFPVYRCSKSHR